MNEDMIVSDRWASLKAFTPARIAQGRAGHSLPTDELLKFQADHAMARDAVYSSLEISALSEQLSKMQSLVFRIHSQAHNRQQYLQRPDLGRKLNDISRQLLIENTSKKVFDVAFVVADGLSASAINRHAVPVLENLMTQLEALNWKVAPFTLVEQGRVAIADEIGFLLKAQIVVILIGERPGLSSPDSMGAYLTFEPKVGLTDESRNCVSNIRPEGLDYEFASNKILYLLQEMHRKKLSGVNLKDEMTLANVLDSDSK